MAIVATTAPTCIKNGSNTNDYIATNIKKTRKQTKYAHFLPTDQAGCFILFVLEATGRLRHHTQVFLDEIAQMERAVFTTGAENEHSANLRRYTVRAIAIVTLRFNARMLAAFHKVTTLRGCKIGDRILPALNIDLSTQWTSPVSRPPATQITSSQERLNNQGLRFCPPGHSQATEKLAKETLIPKTFDAYLTDP